MVTYLCPVCAFFMDDPPDDYNICPCCGTEFGNHDVNTSIENLRITWLRRGANWWSPVDAAPVNWDPYEQLNRLISAPSGGFFGVNPLMFGVAGQKQIGKGAELAQLAA
jgi:hypothetical protein